MFKDFSNSNNYFLRKKKVALQPESITICLKTVNLPNTDNITVETSAINKTSDALIMQKAIWIDWQNDPQCGFQLQLSPEELLEDHWSLTRQTRSPVETESIMADISQGGATEQISLKREKVYWFIDQHWWQLLPANCFSSNVIISVPHSSREERLCALSSSKWLKAFPNFWGLCDILSFLWTAHRSFQLKDIPCLCGIDMEWSWRGSSGADDVSFLESPKDLVQVPLIPPFPHTWSVSAVPVTIRETLFYIQALVFVWRNRSWKKDIPRYGDDIVVEKVLTHKERIDKVKKQQLSCDSVQALRPSKCACVGRLRHDTLWRSQFTGSLRTLQMHTSNEH